MLVLQPQILQGGYYNEKNEDNSSIGRNCSRGDVVRVIEELYYGNIRANEQDFNNTKYQQARNLVADNEEKLAQLLDGEAKQLFLDLIAAQNDINGVTAVESFINGFRIGARLEIEITNDASDYIVDEIV